MIRFPEGSRNFLGRVQIGSIDRPASHSMGAREGGEVGVFTMVKRPGLETDCCVVQNE